MSDEIKVKVKGLAFTIDDLEVEWGGGDTVGVFIAATDDEDGDLYVGESHLEGMNPTRLRQLSKILDKIADEMEARCE